MLILAYATPVSADIVPCSGPDCQTCDLVTLANNGIRWFITVASSIIAIIFAWGGIEMVMSKGEGISEARSKMTNAIIGFIILLSAWLIVDTFLKLLVGKEEESKLGPWHTIDCAAQPTGGGVGQPPDTQPPGTQPPPGPQPPPVAGGTLTHDEALKQLGGIDVVSSGKCSDRNNKTCTSLDGIRSATIQDAVALKDACKCSIVITGGTETGHDTDGTYNHANGYKYDVALNDTLNSYITTNYSDIGVRKDGARMYMNETTRVIYAREDNHWDVLVK